MPKFRNKITGEIREASSLEAVSKLGMNQNELAAQALTKMLGKTPKQELDFYKQKKAIDQAYKNADVGLEKQKAETGKIPAAQLGYYTMATASVNDYENKIRKPLEKGELTYKDIKEAYFKTPTDKTSILNTALYAGADAWLRIQTGAQANPSEIQREMDKYKPRPWDSDKAIENKFKSLFVDRLARYKQNLEENVGKTSGNSATKKTIKLPSGKTMVIGE